MVCFNDIDIPHRHPRTDSPLKIGDVLTKSKVWKQNSTGKSGHENFKIKIDRGNVLYPSPVIWGSELSRRCFRMLRAGNIPRSLKANLRKPWSIPETPYVRKPRHFSSQKQIETHGTHGFLFRSQNASRPKTGRWFKGPNLRPDNFQYI